MEATTITDVGPMGVASPASGSTDTHRRRVALVQRGRMILDVTATDLQVATEVLGPFDPSTWHFRHALAEASQAWDRLEATLGSRALREALLDRPSTILRLDPSNSARRADLENREPLLTIIIGGRTYAVQNVAGSPLAPVIWRLRRLPDHEDGPYYVCRLSDGEYQCDCAAWWFREEVNVPESSTPTMPNSSCKHISSLRDLGWI